MQYNFSRNNEVGDTSHSRELRASCIEFLKWALLEAGSYYNIETGDEMNLRLVKDANYTNGKVWCSRRGFWVWENPIPNQTTQPISVAVYVNNVLQNSNLYKIDYLNGRIIFNTAISTTSTVTAKYCYRGVAVYDGGERTVREIDFLSFSTIDNRLNTDGGSGADLDIPNSRKAQLPCIVVNSGYEFDAVPYETGSTKHIATQNMSFDIYSENGWSLDWLHDSLVLQKDCRIPTFNLDSAPKSYLSDGAVNNSALIFPTRCATYPGKTCYVRKVKSRYLTDFGNVCGVRVDWAVELIAI